MFNQNSVNTLTVGWHAPVIWRPPPNLILIEENNIQIFDLDEMLA